MSGDELAQELRAAVTELDKMRLHVLDLRVVSELNADTARAQLPDREAALDLAAWVECMQQADLLLLRMARMQKEYDDKGEME